MTILIIHYHLRPGGVTRVIENQVKALRTLGHRVIIASSGPAQSWDAETLLLPDLDYQKSGTINHKALLAVKAHLWIIHNPTLGLNNAYPALIEKAALAHIPLILQCHDFAEDGRPANYQLLAQTDRLYPLADHIHYAVINQRDHTHLLNAGLPPDRLHYLPNAVAPAQLPPKVRDSPDNLVLYPVRGIRRKNLGEICLLAKHAPPRTQFAVALAPEDSHELAIHNFWAHFAAEQNLPVSFDVVQEGDFPSWVQRATHLVTTSIAEGFGLTFLEPAFWQKPLIGRDLPEITQDFPPYGTLYQSLPIPLPKIKSTYQNTLKTTWEKYQTQLTDAQIETAWQEFQDLSDFANLPEDAQAAIIKGPPLESLSTWLSDALAAQPSPIDLHQFSLQNYQNCLQTLVTSLKKTGPVTWLPKQKILTQFLNPSRFHFLRT